MTHPVIQTYVGNDPDLSHLKIAIVASEFNESIVEKLLLDTKHALLTQAINTLTIIRVPGAFEIPFAAGLIAKTHQVIIALGVVIRGETSHFDHVCQACVQGIVRTQHDTGTPIVFGVLTTDDEAQAQARVKNGAGVYFAQTALRLAGLSEQLKLN